MSDAKHIKSFFDTRVDEWDTTRYQDETYIGRARVALRFIKARGRGLRVLDMGCGTGHQAQQLIDAGYHVVAADFSPEMARATRERMLRHRPDTTPLVVVADALNPPFKSGTFEVVLALGVVGFISDRPRMLTQVRRLLTPKGEFVCDAGVPESHVLFQVISNKLTALRAAITRKAPKPKPPGWYSQNFIKHTAQDFEQLLMSGGFKPVARGGGGFGDLQIDGSIFVPWRIQQLLAKTLSKMSTLPGGGLIARHALTYVVRSRMLAETTPLYAAQRPRKPRNEAAVRT